jgi:hypothetical protein
MRHIYVAINTANYTVNEEGTEQCVTRRELRPGIHWYIPENNVRKVKLTALKLFWLCVIISSNIPWILLRPYGSKINDYL